MQILHNYFGHIKQIYINKNIFYIDFYIKICTYTNNKIFISSLDIIMSKLHEILHPDSEISRTSAVEEVKQETDTELWEILEEKKDINFSDVAIEEVKRLNPNVQIETDPDRWFIFSSVCVEKLVLPEWFYYNQKNGITNKHNTKSGAYVSIIVYPISHYDPDYL